MASYGHRVQQMGRGDYWLSWTVDYHYSGSRLRFPRCFRRLTDLVGAVRFARRWGLKWEPRVAE